jgi:putative hydrolase of the HAD superfamily
LPPHTKALLLDAMGTLLTFEPPAPRLRAALRAVTGADVGEQAARRAIGAEIGHYRTHLHLGADEAGLARLRLEAAAAMRPELPDPAAGLPPDVLVEVLLDALRFHAFPEVPSTLRELRRRGYRLVVLSNWDVSLHERLDELGLAPLLDGAVASAEFGAAKPDPAVFAHALALAGAEPGRSWHAGDSVEADVQGALAAGVTPVLVARHGEPAPPGVAVVAGLDGLLSVVE